VCPILLCHSTYNEFKMLSLKCTILMFSIIFLSASAEFSTKFWGEELTPRLKVNYLSQSNGKTRRKKSVKWHGEKSRPFFFSCQFNKVFSSFYFLVTLISCKCYAGKKNNVFAHSHNSKNPIKSKGNTIKSIQTRLKSLSVQ